ncbi:MAG: uroporphyrinogen decarboxylase family protein [Armatimonadota bacterium]|nr:uroporphyrinogen decarboxylase family protein [Armatimonadota bacterium]
MELEMTGRERSIKAMNFEPMDRLPIMANGVTPAFVQRLLGLDEEEYWGTQRTAHFETMRRLGQDFHIQMWFPPRETGVWSQAAGEWDDVDEIAAEMEKDAVSLHEQKSDLERNREQRIADIMGYQVATQAEIGNDILWLFGMVEHGPGICHFGYYKYGYEGFFLAVALCPEIVSEYTRAQAELSRVHNECVVEAADRLGWPKIGYTGTDVTTQRGNMLSPETMDKIYFPHLDYALQPLVEAGFKIIWHSDGNMNDMLRPLIDMGVAGFQGFQEECGTRIADVAKLRNRNGDPLILWGSCSVVDVLRHGSLDDVRREVRRVLDEWPHPGLCLATSSYIGEDVPFENVVEFYRACRELGKGRGL